MTSLSPSNSVTIVTDYSEKSMAMFGECTRSLKDELKTMMGYNPGLTYKGQRASGWVFSKSKFDVVMAYLAENSIIANTEKNENHDIMALKQGILSALADETCRSDLIAFLKTLNVT